MHCPKCCDALPDWMIVAFGTGGMNQTVSQHPSRLTLVSNASWAGQGFDTLAWCFDVFDCLAAAAY